WGCARTGTFNNDMISLPEAPHGIRTGTFRSLSQEVEQHAGPQKPIPFAVIQVARHRTVLFEAAYGPNLTAGNSSREAIFDVASLTKPLATASSVAVLLCDGRATLDDQLDQYTLRQLLTHDTKLPILPDWKKLPSHRWSPELVTELVLTQEPQSTSGYTNTGYTLLGLWVEKSSGTPLDQFAHANVFAPLGMTSTTWRPNASLTVRTAKDQQPGRPFDPFADYAQHLGNTPGHSGLFSTVGDVGRFAQSLLNPETPLEKCLAGVLLQPAAPRYTLGFERREDGTLEHTGYTGCLLWLDPTSGTSLVLLTNQTLTGAEPQWLELKQELIRKMKAGIIRKTP
ncbi:MAG: serine hydrolase domain-containing protein, partial [Candidatus Sumerlaeia bacterium]|nr:serine hydrolase domain-containing protein [Candidatus Sumerlaeia bacterium]